jgi:hypothetical protein
MKRQILDDYGWFDRDAAQFWNETTHVVEGERERLYRTRRGSWVVHHWAQSPGRPDSWVRITSEDAVRWFIRCELPVPTSLDSWLDSTEV